MIIDYVSIILIYVYFNSIKSYENVNLYDMCFEKSGAVERAVLVLSHSYYKRTSCHVRTQTRVSHTDRYLVLLFGEASQIYRIYIKVDIIYVYYVVQCDTMVTNPATQYSCAPLY